MSVTSPMKTYSLPNAGNIIDKQHDWLTIANYRAGSSGLIVLSKALPTPFCFPGVP